MHRSPKGNWEFIKNGPAFVLFFIGAVTSQMEFARSQAPVTRPEKFEKVCREVPNEVLGIPLQECDFVYTPGTIEFAKPSLSPLLDWFKDGFVSILLDIPVELIGVWLGVTMAKRYRLSRNVESVGASLGGNPDSG
jgi:hypothetical protein